LRERLAEEELPVALVNPRNRAMSESLLELSSGLIFI